MGPGDPPDEVSPAVSTVAAPETRTIAPVAWPQILIVTMIACAAMIFAASRYHLFADELYFVVAGQHPSVSYADQGPAIPLLAATMNKLGADSLVGFRAPAILITAVAIWVTALIAREMGGRTRAQVLAALAYATSPLLLLQAHTLATNTFDASLWVVTSWLVVRWIRTRRDVLLLAAGVVTAVDVQVKWLIPVFWLAVGVSALVYGPRELLRRPLLWVGAAIVVVTAVPALIWQAQHGWPQVALGSAVAGEQQSFGGGRLTFLPILLIYAGVLGAALAVFGTVQLFRSPALRDYRLFGAACLLVVILFVAAGGRPYYPAGMLGVIFAAGAVELGSRSGRRVVVAAASLSAAALVTVAFSLPWTPRSHIKPTSSEATAASQITVYGEFGWRQLAQDVQAAQRAQVTADPSDPSTAIVTASYWQAAGLDYYGSGLPPVFSPDRGMGYLDRPPDSARTILYVAATPPPTDRCVNRELLHTITGRLAYPGASTDVSIWRCHIPGRWSQLWPGLRHM